MNTQRRKRTPLRRLFSLIMALFMAVMIIPDVKPLRAQAATTYDIYILGHQVTSENQNNILGNSSGVKFKFVPNTNTLHVTASGGDTTIYTKDERYYQGSSHIIYSTYPYDLTISIDNDVTFVDNKDITPINQDTNKKITLTGSGKLTYNGKDGNTDFIKTQNAVSFSDANLDLSCYCIASSRYSSAPPRLYINNSNVTVQNYSYLTYCIQPTENTSATLNNCYFSDPEDAYIGETYYIPGMGSACVNRTYVVRGSGTSVHSFTIKAGEKPDPVTVYDGLKICGTQVTSVNKDDILGNGEISYDPDSTTLTVKKSIESNDVIIENTGIDDLNITAEADNLSLWGKATDPVIYTTKSINFTGAKRLSLSTRTTGIRVKSVDGFNPTVTISSPLLISAGAYGIYGASAQTLNLYNSNIHIYDSSGKNTAAIMGFRTINLASGVVIDKPQPYTLNYGNAGSIRDKNGKIAKEIQTAASASYSITIDSTAINSSNCHDVFKDGKVSFDKNTNTLYIEGEYGNFSSTRTNLNIVLTGDTSFTKSKGTCNISLGNNSVITGSGKLTCENITSASTRSYTLNNVEVICNGSIYASSGNITINNSVLNISTNLYTNKLWFKF